VANIRHRFDDDFARDQFITNPIAPLIVLHGHGEELVGREKSGRSHWSLVYRVGANADTSVLATVGSGSR
jgi:hypothetical protein